VQTIGEKHTYEQKDLTKLLMCVSLNSEFGAILKVFVLFDKFVLQNKFFMATLDETVLHDWNSFSQMMQFDCIEILGRIVFINHEELL
jgi:hypothetical protein